MSRPELAADSATDKPPSGTPDTPGMETEEAEQRADDPLRIPAPGEPIGHFFVIDVLGQGAMGVVVRAFDPRLERTLAIKLVHPRRSDAAARARARLVAEARALARISHPNVVAVYEVDVHDGRDYVAMELVEGIDLQKWLRQRPRSWREVIQAFAAAADGLAAVHAAGLVHRDIKPANILVGNDGRVRVGDFGIATRSTDAPSQPGDVVVPRSVGDDDSGDGELTSLTEEGQVVGTPAYMAPEQHHGQEVGPAADQYAFCVSLFEALYHERPFRVPLLRLAIAKQSPPREPRGHRVPRWLFRVVERGLAPDPAQRFASMAELARALRKDSGRRRRRVAFAAAIVAGTVAGALAMSSRRACEDAEAHLAGLWDGDVRARVEQAFEASTRPFATQAWAQASTELDGYAARWIAMHTDACAATTVRGEQSQAMLDRRMACLDQRKAALAAAVELLAGGGDDAIDHAYDLVGRLRPIAPCGDISALAATVAPPEDPRVRAEVESVRTELARATAARIAGRYDEALELSGPPLQIARELGYEPLLAEAQLVRADALTTRDRFEEAVAAASEAVWTAIAIGDDETATAAAISLLWVSSEDLRDFPAAQRWAELGEALLRRSGDDDLLAARLGNATGAWQQTTGRYEEAIATYERALARVADDEAATQVVHNIRINLANVWNINGHLPRAREAYEREIAELGALIGHDHPQVIGVRRVLADLLGKLGEHEQAIALSREVADAFARIYGTESSLFGHAQISIGLALDRTGDSNGALAAYLQAVDVFTRSHDPVGLAIAYNNAGEVQLRLGVFDAAAHSYDRAIAIHEELYPGDHADRVFPLTGKARLLGLQRRWDEAMATALEAERMAKVTVGPDSHELISAMDTHMALLEQQGRNDEALVVARDGLTIALRTEDQRPRTRPLAHGHVASLLNRLGRHAEALEHADAALVAAAGLDDPELGCDLELERGLALGGVGRFEEAAAAARRAEQLAKQAGLEEMVRRAHAAAELFASGRSPL